MTTQNANDTIVIRESFSILKTHTKVDLVRVRELFSKIKSHTYTKNDRVVSRETFSIVSKNFFPGPDLIKVRENFSRTHQHWLTGIIPTLDIYSWDTTDVSPSGRRHIPSGISFKNHISNLGYLPFGDIAHSGISSTECLTFKVKRQVGKFAAGNFKIWKTSSSGVGVYGGDISINALSSSNWIRNIHLPSGSGFLLKETLPVDQNIFRNDYQEYINCALNNQYIDPDSDAETSQYVYLSMNLSPSGYNNGLYGVGGSGELKVRVSYEFYIGEFDG